MAELGAALAGERLKPLEVGVYGHTDASGAAAYNQKLSEKRAAAVVQYLVQRFSLEPKRLRHAGYGEERLLEGIDANSPRHRRVEIVVFAAARPVTAESQRNSRLRERLAAPARCRARACTSTEGCRVARVRSGASACRSAGAGCSA